MREIDTGVAGTLAVDAMTVWVLRGLRDRAVEPILLKGRSFAEWLYPESGRRVYGDCDLLVSPTQHQTAENVLVDLGFLATPLPPGAQHARAWIRPSDGATVDLHTSIWGAPDHDVAWRELSKGTQRIRLGPIDVTVLDEPGRCVHAVLHWVQHPTLNRPRTDLDRAIDRVDDNVWIEAVELARRIGAGEIFLHGLMNHPSGVELTQRLGVTPSAPPSVELSLLLSRDQTGAATIEWFRSFPGFRTRLEAIRHTLLPNAEYLRLYAEGESAGRSTASLYVRYWVRQVRKAPGAFLHWFGVWRSFRHRRGSE